MDRNIKLTNSDNGKTVEIPLNKLDDGLSSELKEVEERTGKTVTGISLEMENIRAGKPHNLGFSFD